MNFKKVSAITLVCLSFSAAAQANEVILKTDKPVTIAFRMAHVTQDKQVVLGELQTVEVNESLTLPVDLKDHDRVGIAIVSANGHVLPASVVGFNQAQQCSMTTDKTKTTGTIEFVVTDHLFNCRTSGGVFG